MAATTDDLARARVAFDLARAHETVDRCKRTSSEMGVDAFAHGTRVGSRVAKESVGDQDNLRVGTCHLAARDEEPTTVVSTDQ